jgi:hypothetical protein
MEPPKTVRVRICVVIDDKGHWSSAGWKGKRALLDSDLIDIADAADITEGNNTRIYFIEADLELPTPPTIQGIVEEVKA